MRKVISLLPVAACLAAWPAAAGAADAAVDALFQSVPQPPGDPCGATAAEKEAWRDQLDAFSQRLDGELERRRKEGRAQRKADGERVKAELAERNPELARMDRAKLRKMSKAEKMAMVQQAMAAQGVGGLPAEAGPLAGGAPAPTTGAAPPGAGEAAAAAKLQRELSERVAAREAQGRQGVEAFRAAEPQAVAAVEERELGQLRPQVSKILGQTIEAGAGERARWSQADRDRWAERRRKEADTIRKYDEAARRACAQLGPGWRDAVAAYRAAVVAGRADYDRLDGGEAGVAAGTGLALTAAPPGLAGLEALRRYLEVARQDPFRFDQRLPPGRAGQATTKEPTP